MAPRGPRDAPTLCFIMPHLPSAMTFMTFMAFKTFMTHGNVIFDILEPLAFRNIAHVGSYRNLKNLKKFVHACVVNVIHSKALPGSVLYVED